MLLQHVRHPFGPTDSPTGANYALRRTPTDYHFTILQTAKSVHDKVYMAEYLELTVTVGEASRKANLFVYTLSFGGFILTKFVSNLLPISSQQISNSPKKITERSFSKKKCHTCWK